MSWLGQFCHQTNFPVKTGSLARVKTRSQGGSQPGTSLQFPAGSWLNKGRLGFTSHFKPTCLPSRFPAILPNHKQHSTFPFCSLKTTCSDVPQSHGDGVCTLHSGNSFIVGFLSMHGARALFFPTDLTPDLDILERFRVSLIYFPCSGFASIWSYARS